MSKDVLVLQKFEGADADGTTQNAPTSKSTLRWRPSSALFFAPLQLFFITSVIMNFRSSHEIEGFVIIIAEK